VDRVHNMWIRRRGSGPPWTEAARTRGRSDALPARGARVVGLAGGDGGERGNARVVLTGARAAAKRRRGEGEE
jgi:hypothetical protein